MPCRTLADGVSETSDFVIDCDAMSRTISPKFHWSCRAMHTNKPLIVNTPEM